MREKRGVKPRRPGSGSGGDFEKMASRKSGSLAGEVVAFLRENKKWWLLPLIAVLVLVGALVVLSSTAVAPFIYTLF